MHEMILNERVWSGSRSKHSRLHAFLGGADGPGACRKNIKAGNPELRSANEMIPVPSWVEFCQSCQDEVLRMVNRREDSMQPSTGEGDHLPPAVELTDELGFPLVGAPTVIPEVIAALAVIRGVPDVTPEDTLFRVMEAFDVLDEAGLFDRVDDAAMQSPNPGPLHTMMRMTDPGRIARVTMSDRIPGLRLIQGGAATKRECGKPDQYGNPCYLNLGHSHDCMH